MAHPHRRLAKNFPIQNVLVMQKRYIGGKIRQPGVGWLGKILFWSATAASTFVLAAVNWKTYTDYVAAEEKGQMPLLPLLSRQG
jgi:hypothetical protein